ncbi:CWF19-like protein 1 [Wickerhamomyces ciferrii]|uniref:CWF19-like protein 1 n=1 Tax=Wickerhamomyces ciferrii (strain ATCC 14091 / BCRC 22168 / CBS 111 / JCM 3599 / NBRC 0793 / NRRL Y-1031 F-60-10) TaxID=1206466 RepID=K0KBJ3_WICCF|nr:CWF19-like protein 1 [Wickerhamomyces ciferrii]CCH42400.1 CWF19-like protein 1 [Wickerhamomyces ciferrii]
MSSLIVCIELISESVQPKGLPQLAYPGQENISTVITKTNALNKKSGPFDATIFLGDVISKADNENTSKPILVDVEHPIYFTADSSSDITQSIPNFNNLGNFGVHAFANEITLAFITGDESTINENLNEFKSKIEGKEIDILVTYQWPKVISHEAKLFLGNSNIDTIVKLTKPKYHFAIGSQSGHFLERLPFEWEDGSITRFISLSKFGFKEKWIYAFNYSKGQDSTPPKTLTPNPFTTIQDKEEGLASPESKKRKAQDSDLTPINDESQPIAKKHAATNKVVLPENCFFCLSNPKLKEHLIISIGEHSYLTIAKGPLTRPTDKMKFSGHCLIIPIAHNPRLEQNVENIQKEDQQTLSEVLRYELSLVKLFASFNLGTVIFQINKSNNVHFHNQVFPVAVDFLTDFEKTLNKNASINNTKYTRNVQLNFRKFNDDTDEEYQSFLRTHKDFISFKVFNKSIEDKSIYVSDIDSLDKPLDLQFGRRVLAYLLQVPKRIKWDKCQQSEQRETQETETFKEAFKPFDFTAEL